MKRLLLLALVAALFTLRQRGADLQQARADYDGAVSDLIASQEAQLDLADERDEWRELACLHFETLVHLISQPVPDPPAPGGPT